MIDLGFFVAFLIYGLNLMFVSIGLSIIFGVYKYLNLAHGSFYVLGGYLASYFALILSSLFGLALALPIAIPLGLLIAYSSQALRRQEAQLLFTYSLALLFEGVFKLVFGVGNYTAASLANSLGTVELYSAVVPGSYVAGFAVLIASLAALMWYIYRTKMGLYIRAVIDDAEMAVALGVKARLASVTAAVIGALMAVIGGSITSLWQAYSLGLAAEMLVHAFSVVAVAGTANIWGVVPASLLISFVRTLAVYYFPAFELFAIYLVVLLVLLIKPEGLFARHARVA